MYWFFLKFLEKVSVIVRVANQFICPVFKWGTKEEWEFGLQRIIKFPQDRKPSERTYLLKTLAGCPNDSWKIERLLNITVLEQNGNFTDNDIYLIFSMLTGGSNGYTTLFHFLRKNWDVIKARQVILVIDLILLPKFLKKY